MDKENKLHIECGNMFDYLKGIDLIKEKYK